MTTDRLLAKSRQGDGPLLPSQTLPGHLADVYNAARAVLAATAADQLRALGLSEAPFRGRLERCVLLAAAAHDLGKANDHFQEMLAGRRQRQGLRHEWVTVLMLEAPELGGWLRPAAGDDVDWQVALWAVAGHHPAYGRPSPPRTPVEGGGRALTAFLGHDDFAACLGRLREWFGLGPPPALADRAWPLVGRDNVFDRIFRWFQAGTRVWAGMGGADRRLVAAVKDCLVAADVAGSALPRRVGDEQARGRWVAEAFARVPSAARLGGIVSRRLNGAALRQFQHDVGASAAPVTFVRAGCGSGKTLAAYHWAASRHPGRRLYFCYPTTGTATEGFRDYLFDPDEQADADLFHGRAEVDFDIILGGRGDERDRLARIESLDAWSTPVVSCTVDTVLGLVQNNRRGLYAWPALAGAAFVFDEVHAYDDRLFGALLRFLQALPGVPVLLMTASLPRARLEALRQCLARTRKLALPVIGGPEELERLERYHRHPDVDDPLAVVREEVKRGGKVLWVCNTVDRAIDAAGGAADLAPLVYHSRFRYEDRVRRHRAVVDAFDPAVTPGPALAVCTQVAEMSLDLSAALLVSDLAPVPALIQRLGRLNRRARDGDPTRPFVVVEPASALPYTPEALAAARAWLDALGAGPLSQQGLARAWEDLDAGTRPAFVASAWLDGGPATEVLELREASPGVTVVLERDLAALRSGAVTAARVALPMPPPPRALDWRAWGAFRGIPVAPEGKVAYDPERGARWRAS
nr:CRISPR-associated helicase Cas3 [uncultured bacterium]